MKTYTNTQIQNSIAKLFNIRKAVKTSYEINKFFNKKSFVSDNTWNEINEALTNFGWSNKHIIMLNDNLRAI